MRLFVILWAIVCCLYPIVIEAGATINVDVLIIGAGIAGIKAATVFEENGVSNFLVLESRSQMGGRMTDVAFGNLRLELGANWILGTVGNPLYDLALSAGLQTQLQDWDSVTIYDENGTLVADNQIPWSRYEDAVDCINELASQIKQGVYARDVNMRAAYRLCGWEPQTPVERAIEWWEDNGERPA